MASTRNKNTMGDYHLEQRAFESNVQYNTYIPYGKAETSLYAGDGLVGGRKANTELSYNAHDIESYLRGIGSTNLVMPKIDPVLQAKTLQSLNIIDRVQLILPEPLAVKKDQRPYLN